MVSALNIKNELRTLSNMKTFLISGLVLLSTSFFYSCDSTNDPQANDLTGRQVTYNLIPGDSQLRVSGTIDFRERSDKSILVEIKVNSTGSGGEHPVHLHLGTLETADAPILALLTPVDAVTGVSTTSLTLLDDQTQFSYEDLLNFNGSVKVHMDDGPNKDVVLAGTNIGINSSMDIGDIAVCSSKEAI
jgi:hypothetical protein